MTVSKSAKKSTRRSAAIGASWSPSYSECLQCCDVSKVRTYRTSESFVLNDTIEHPSFGLGFVRELKAGNKIVVLFEDRSRVMLHTPAPPPEQEYALPYAF